jgi:hypothetical protein
MLKLDSSILRIGCPNGGSDDDVTSSALRTAIVSFFQNKNTKSVDGSNNSLVELSNRYFDAKVALLKSDEIVDQSSHVNEDGMLLAFIDTDSRTDSKSFDRLTMVHEETVASGRCGDLLRLCIGITFAPPQADRNSNVKAYEEEYSRRVLWCLDRGYEYIETDLSEEGQTTGHDVREKDGFPRVIEAIQGTVWSSSIRKTPTVTKTVSPSSSTLSLQSITVEDLDPPKILSSKNVHSGKEELKSSPLIPSFDLPSVSKNDVPGKRFEYLEDEDSKDDLMLRDLDNVLREVSRIRYASKNGLMNDGERRKRAENTILSMMGIMDSIHFGDEDEIELTDSSDEEEEIKKNLGKIDPEIYESK